MGSLRLLATDVFQTKKGRDAAEEEDVNIWGKLEVFVSDDFKGHWPVGTSAVIVARDEDQARELLQAELIAHGLGGHDAFTVRKIQTERPQAFVLQDGEY